MLSVSPVDGAFYLDVVASRCDLAHAGSSNPVFLAWKLHSNAFSRVDWFQRLHTFL